MTNHLTKGDIAVIASGVTALLTQITACAYAGHKLSNTLYTGSSTSISVLAGVGIGAAAYLVSNMISGVCLSYIEPLFTLKDPQIFAATMAGGTSMLAAVSTRNIFKTLDVNLSIFNKG